MKIIYTGLEGEGKSLQLARKVRELIKRNSKWGKEIGRPRPICTNEEFSPELIAEAKEKGVPIHTWTQLTELIKYKECDVIIDEVGNYFDARNWSHLNLDARRWLSQGSKSGIELYGTAQDFAQIDVAFRRLVNAVIEIRKIVGSRRPAATKPPINRIWGLCVGYSINPSGYRAMEAGTDRGWWPTMWFTIRRKDCLAYNTTQYIARSEFPALKHEEHFCEKHRHMGGDGSCVFCRIVHA